MNNKRQDTEQCADSNSRRAVCTEEIKKTPTFIITGGSRLRLNDCQTFQSPGELLITRLDYKSIIKSNNYGLKTRNQKLSWLQQTTLTPQGLSCLLSILCALLQRESSCPDSLLLASENGALGISPQFPGSSSGIA